MERAQPLADLVVHHYLVLHRYQHRASHQLRKHLGISGRQAAILHYLVADGLRTAREISRYLYVRDATVSPMLDGMERAGWITRRRCEQDARKLMIKPTDLGREMAAKAPLTMLETLRVRLPDLPESELLAIDTALQRLIEIAEIDETLVR